MKVAETVVDDAADDHHSTMRERERETYFVSHLDRAFSIQFRSIAENEKRIKNESLQNCINCAGLIGKPEPTELAVGTH